MRLAPLNPAFIAYQQAQALHTTRTSAPVSQYSLGYIPSPADLPSVAAATAPITKSVTVFPPVFDLRTLGKLPPIRDQGLCGACWTYATYSSLESRLKVAETKDFSESHLVDTHGFDYPQCTGGNTKMAMAYLARWNGAVEETAYPAPIATSNVVKPVVKHLQSVDFISRAGALDNDAVKAMLMAQGAVSASHFWDPAYYNTTTKAFYNGVNTTTNHGVAIVGWDDNFPRSRFATQPSGDGAFIVRNSWGTVFGEAGYFYVSYYDTSLRIEGVFHGVESTTNYTRAYEYDPLGWTSAFGFGAGTGIGWFANMFTADASNASIRAVSFYTTAPNSSYEVYVYNNVLDNQPRSGTLLGVATTGTIANAGYHTIHLNAPANVTPNGRFAVVVKLTTPNATYPIVMEKPVAGFSSAATAVAGQSFVGSNGTTWRDMTSYYANTNVCLKAFAGTSGKTPDTFVFSDQVNVAPATLIEANTVTLSGITEASPISITGGEYKINNGSYTALAGMVNNGDTLRVRHTSAGAIATATHTTVTVGGISDTFSSLTSNTPPQTTSCTGSLAVGAGTSSAWEATCASTHKTGSYARYYTFSLSAAQTVTINLTSSAQDAYLFLLAGSGTGGSVIASNDDGGGGTQSRITQTLAAGTYTVEATTYYAGKTGAFTLALAGSSPPPPEPTGCTANLAVGASANGTWAASCTSTHKSGSYAYYYTFSLSAAQTVTIDLTSSAQDAYLYLLSGSGTAGSVVDSNDDVGGSTQSRITRTLAAGTYTVEATTY